MNNAFTIVIGVILSLLLITAAGAKIGGGDITFRVPARGDVIYSHDVHAGRFGLTCTECHYRIFSRSANNDRDRTNMAGMLGGRSCGACHNGSRAFDVKSNCNRCHTGAPAQRK